jgi:hypothetical protein
VTNNGTGSGANGSGSLFGGVKTPLIAQLNGSRPAGRAADVHATIAGMNPPDSVVLQALGCKANQRDRKVTQQSRGRCCPATMYCKSFTDFEWAKSLTRHLELG